MTVDGKRKFIVNTIYVALICAIVFFIFKYLTIWLLPFFHRLYLRPHFYSGR